MCLCFVFVCDSVFFCVIFQSNIAIRKSILLIFLFLHYRLVCFFFFQFFYLFISLSVCLFVCLLRVCVIVALQEVLDGRSVIGARPPPHSGEWGGWRACDWWKP